MDSIVELINQLLGLAKNITGFLGEGEATGIIALVKSFFEKLDPKVLTDAFAAISALFGA